MKIRMGQKTKDTWRIEEPQMSNSGNKTYLGESHKLAKWDVMYPTTHDLHIQHIDLHLKTLRELLENGNRVVIVTKPSIKCVKAICDNLEDNWEQFVFRFSIGTLNNAELKKWEPNAPSVQHRLNCIEYAHSRGFNTSISMEPLLFNDAQDVIERVRPL
jgi:DNA repair photolyase